MQSWKGLFRIISHWRSRFFFLLFFLFSVQWRVIADVESSGVLPPPLPPNFDFPDSRRINFPPEVCLFRRIQKIHVGKLETVKKENEKGKKKPKKMFQWNEKNIATRVKRRDDDRVGSFPVDAAPPGSTEDSPFVSKTRRFTLESVVKRPLRADSSRFRLDGDDSFYLPYLLPTLYAAEERRAPEH